MSAACVAVEQIFYQVRSPSATKNNIHHNAGLLRICCQLRGRRALRRPASVGVEQRQGGEHKHGD
jgi:hypothetical protein